jgi:hypothetical protein
VYSIRGSGTVISKVTEEPSDLISLAPLTEAEAPAVDARIAASEIYRIHLEVDGICGLFK